MQVRFAGANRQSPACFDPSAVGEFSLFSGIYNDALMHCESLKG